MSRCSPSLVRLVAVCLAISVLSLIAAGLWFYLTHRESIEASAESAETELTRLRANFSTQRPLLDSGGHAELESSNSQPEAQPLRAFHTVIFDTRGVQRIVRMTVPYWMGRIFAGRAREFSWLGQLTFLDDTEFDSEPIHLPLKLLERRGPGLVAYYRHPSGGVFISWVE